MSGTASSFARGVTEDQAIRWYGNLNRPQRVILEKAWEDATGAAMTEAIYGKWAEMTEEEQNESIASHFIKGLESLYSNKPRTQGLKYDNNTFASWDRTRVENYRNATETNLRELYSIITRPAGTASRCYQPGVPDLSQMLQERFGKDWKEEKHRQEVVPLYSSFANTSDVVSFAARFNSVAEAREFERWEHCPSNLKADSSGLAGVAHCRQFLETSRETDRTWDTTDHQTPQTLRGYYPDEMGQRRLVDFMRSSAMRETPKIFDQLGLPPLGSTEALHSQAAARRRGSSGWFGSSGPTTDSGWVNSLRNSSIGRGLFGNSRVPTLPQQSSSPTSNTYSSSQFSFGPQGSFPTPSQTAQAPPPQSESQVWHQRGVPLRNGYGINTSGDESNYRLPSVEDDTTPIATDRRSSNSSKSVSFADSSTPPPMSSSSGSSGVEFAPRSLKSCLKTTGTHQQGGLGNLGQRRVGFA